MRNEFEYNGIRIRWLNHHAAFLITTKNGRNIVTDPWEVTDEKADIILVTHSHYDHLDPDSIRRIRDAGTSIIGPADCRDKVSGNFKDVTPGVRLNEEGIIIEAVPAYNVAAERKKFHPAANKWVGFLVHVDGVMIYHGGDTDVIEEMKNLKDVDIALLPAGGTYTMDGKEAAQAANIIKPKIAVPMHWGKIVGSRKDADTFKEQFKGETKILE